MQLTPERHGSLITPLMQARDVIASESAGSGKEYCGITLTWEEKQDTFTG